MAQEIIDLGTGADTGTGDPLRTALTKTKDNFSELYGFVYNPPFTSQSANYTATLEDLVIDGTATLTLTLPTAVGNNKLYKVKNSGVGTVTIDPDGTETIDGATTKALTANQFVTIISNGTNWLEI